MTDLNHAHRTGRTRLAQPHPTTAPPLDKRTADEAAYQLAAAALIESGGVCYGGDWYDAKSVRIRRRDDGAPDSIGLVIEDATHGEAVLVTILIAATPIGA